MMIKMVPKYIHQKIKKKKCKNSTPKEQIFIDISFYGKPTKTLGKQLTALAKYENPQINILPIPRPLPSISDSLPFKDQIPKELQSKIIYMINCSNCASSYIGKIIRRTTKGFKEYGLTHKLSTNNKTKPSKTIEYHGN